MALTYHVEVVKFNVQDPLNLFQDPLEARNETNTGRVKVFTSDRFSKATATQKWDQVGDDQQTARSMHL